MLNKITPDLVKEEEVIDFQPSDREIEQYDNNNNNDESNLSDDEYVYLQKEIDYFYSTPPPSYYSLSREDNRGNWDKPHVTRTKGELFDQLYFYDAIKERENLTKSQLEDVEREVKKIYKELDNISNYEFFLKHGHEKLHANKNKFTELQNIKFYQREENLWVAEGVENHVKINLPMEKWWISENEILKHADIELHTFVDFRLVNSLTPSLNKRYAQIKFYENDAPVDVDAPVIQQEIKMQKTMPALPTQETKKSFMSKLFKKRNKPTKDNMQVVQADEVQILNTDNDILSAGDNKTPVPGKFPEQKDKPAPSPNQFPNSKNESINPNPFPNPSKSPTPGSNFPNTNNNDSPTPPVPPPGIANNNKNSLGSLPIPPRSFADGSSSIINAPPIPQKSVHNNSNRNNINQQAANQIKNYFDYQAKQ